MLSFGEALSAIKFGRRVTRVGWSNPELWLRLYRPENMDPCILVHHPPHVLDVMREGPQYLWHPSHSDLLADDWYIVKSE